MTIAGRWAILWPQSGWSALDLPHIAADLVALGFAGVSLHSGLHVADEAQPRADTFRDAGLRVAVGIGFPRPASATRAGIAEAIVDAIRGGFDHVQLDWEGSWDGHRDDAADIVARVRAEVPELPCPVTSLCWWAPKTLPNGHGTHPSAPTSEFLSLTAPDVPVAPQCYNGGHIDDETAWQLRWARKQYAPRPVVPTIQGYGHSVADRVALFKSEPTVIVWDYLELDANCRAALGQVR